MYDKSGTTKTSKAAKIHLCGCMRSCFLLMVGLRPTSLRGTDGKALRMRAKLSSDDAFRPSRAEMLAAQSAATMRRKQERMPSRSLRSWRFPKNRRRSREESPPRITRKRLGPEDNGRGCTKASRPAKTDPATAKKLEERRKRIDTRENKNCPGDKKGSLFDLTSVRLGRPGCCTPS